MKRPGDKTPDPPGGRALARLRMFEAARTGASEIDATEKTGPESTPDPGDELKQARAPGHKRRRSHEKSKRRAKQQK